jgi:class 3 adenylate cyclase
MEPRIQYAQTADGVSIAFLASGQGVPFVCVPNHPLTYLQMEWEFPQIRRWYERLGERRMLVRYDGRGWGLSDRDIVDQSLEAQILDLQAVVDHLSLERFVLYGALQLGPVAIAYAARNPQRVSHLILWCTYARASDYYRSRQLRALRELLQKDWELYTETIAHIIAGFSKGVPSHQAAERYRESVPRDSFLASASAFRQFDVAAILPDVKSPTLVLHRRQFRLLDVSIARQLASGIPDARLALQDGDILNPWSGDTKAALTAIDSFLSEGEDVPEVAGVAGPSGLVTILFTDMEGSTSLTQRLGDAKAQELVRTHNTIVRDALKACGGSEIKHTGDGIMASFASASRALECAIAIQRAVAARAEEQSEALLRVRIGLNAGEPVAEEKDLFGTAVQLAARICAHAEPGQILVPIVVRELAAGKGFLLSDCGDVVLRGFEDPVRLYEVRWE